MRAMFIFFSYVCLGLLFSAALAFETHAQIKEATALAPEASVTTASTTRNSVGVAVSIASEKRLSFDDVYSIELQLPVSGHVELNAIHGEEIIVRLEKHGRGLDEQSVQAYLEVVDVTAFKVNDALQLAVKLPEILDTGTELTRLDCFVHTPPDVALKIRTQNGDIRVNGIRGNLNLQAVVGHVRLNKTMGGYQVHTGEGRIYGEILLTNKANQFDTGYGAIDLVVLDSIASPTDLTATGGGITLRLPKSFQAEVEIRTKDRNPQAVAIELPAKVEGGFAGDAVYGWLNGGGPLFRLTAKDQIAILPLEGSSAKEEAPEEDPTPQSESVWRQPVPKALEPPVIDGNLFEKAWSHAVPLQPFIEANGVDVPDEPTQAFLMWDDRHLYIGVKIYSSEMGKLRISHTESGSAVWDDDSLEILVDPNPDTELYYHLVVNPLGTVFNQIIRSDYPAGSRFPPIDIKPTGESKRESMPAMMSSISKIGPEPNGINTFSSTDTTLAKIKTQITAHYWSVEVALARCALEPELTGDWRFNLHRKAQQNREFSYWSPTYDTEMPWWPHCREQMGSLQLTEEIGESSLLQSEDRLEIEQIEVKGNIGISTTEVIQELPFHPGEIITSHQLSWLLGELEEHPWFQKAGLETIQLHPDNTDPDSGFNQEVLDTSSEQVQASSEVYEPSDDRHAEFPLRVTLRLHVTESPCIVRQQFDLIGNKRFDSELLYRWFGLTPGRIPIEVLSIKSQLIRQLYRNQGYELARVEERFTEDMLQIVIDEGRLDEVRFTGTRRLEQHELAQAFGLHAGDIYNLMESQVQIGLTRAELKRRNPIFKDFRGWRAKREEGKNILVIDVEEQSPIRFNLSPRLNFNRVHGLVLGVGNEVSTNEYGRGRAFGSLSLGLASSIWNHQLGAEKSWFEHLELRIGGSLYKLTGVVDSASLSGSEGLLSALLIGDSFFDYYQRQGYQAWLTQELTSSTSVVVEFTDEQHTNLFKSTDWSLAKRRQLKRSNSRIDTGNARTLAIFYRFDTRDRKSYAKEAFRLMPQPNAHTRRGWRGALSVEYSGSKLDSHFDFILYRFELMRHNRLSDRQNLNFRVVGAFSDASLPRQRLLCASGINTLRGYDSNRFIGDNMLALTAEYRTHREFAPSSEGGSVKGAASLFFDIGDTWFDNESFELDRLNASVGVGLSVFRNTPKAPDTSNTLHVEIARALRKRHGINVILRLAQVF